MVVLGGVAVFYERGTPVPDLEHIPAGTARVGGPLHRPLRTPLVHSFRARTRPLKQGVLHWRFRGGLVFKAHRLSHFRTHQISNTFLLEQRGWAGLCIDPFPAEPYTLNPKPKH